MPVSLRQHDRFMCAEQTLAKRAIQNWHSPRGRNPCVFLVSVVYNQRIVRTCRNIQAAPVGTNAGTIAQIILQAVPIRSIDTVLQAVAIGAIQAFLQTVSIRPIQTVLQAISVVQVALCVYGEKRFQLYTRYRSNVYNYTVVSFDVSELDSCVSHIPEYLVCFPYDWKIQTGSVVGSPDLEVPAVLCAL